MSARVFLQALTAGHPFGGRHLVVTAHPDDETISASAVLSLGLDVRILQLTDGVPPASEDRAATMRVRAAERAAAFIAAGWTWPVTELAIAGREAWGSLAQLIDVIRATVVEGDTVWTHPYEGGHLDHDTAAAAVQLACAGLGVRRMEFASYHSRGVRRDIFGSFWPDRHVVTQDVALRGDVLERKQRAVAAYGSQAHILRKFPDIARESYRSAPVYDFTQPAPPPACRWDLKGYQPSTAVWRRAVADLAVPA